MPNIDKSTPITTRHTPIKNVAIKTPTAPHIARLILSSDTPLVDSVAPMIIDIIVKIKNLA